jgi:acetate---CoA ligase (ADP-forming)
MTASPESIARLMAATRVAVVGASNDPTKLTGRPIAYMLRRGFKGEIIPINPTRSEVQGLKAFPSLGSLDALIKVSA